MVNRLGVEGEGKGGKRDKKAGATSQRDKKGTTEPEGKRGTGIKKGNRRRKGMGKNNKPAEGWSLIRAKL